MVNRFSRGFHHYTQNFEHKLINSEHFALSTFPSLPDPKNCFRNSRKNNIFPPERCEYDKQKIDPIIQVKVGNEYILSKPAVRYLGIMIDSKLSFWEQIKSSADKAARGVSSLSRLMTNTGGPRSSKRRLLMTSVQSVLLYGAEIWADSLSKKKYRTRLAQVQRRAALRVASAYRTVSEPAVLVIAGVIPISLLARERKAVYLRKSEGDKEAIKVEERARTMQEWQSQWDQEPRGRWSYRLIRCLKSWIERPFGEIDYYLTQFLSGHGYFLSYLYRMGKVASPDCIYCPGISDDAHHTFFICPKWERNRRHLEEQCGHVTPENIVPTMTRGQSTWDLVSRYVHDILHLKKADMDRG